MGFSMNDSTYKKMVEESAHGIFLCKNNQFVYVNDTFANLLGYKKSELQDNRVSSVVHPDYKKELGHFFDQIKKDAGKKDKHKIEFKAQVRKNSSLLPHFVASLLKKEYASSVWLKLYSCKINLDGRSLIMGHVFNISDEKHCLAKLSDTYEDAIELISGTIELNNIYQTSHHKKLQKLTQTIARGMGLSEHQVDSLKYASKVHGIGKLTVPAEILSSTGELSSMEFSYLKEHPIKGYELLKKIDFPWPIADILHQHHERVDGSGYPNRLEGDEIMLEARIFAVADVIIAMSSQRPFRSAYHIGEVLQEVINQKGKLYDSEVVKACVKVFREGFQLFDEEEH